MFRETTTTITKKIIVIIIIIIITVIRLENTFLVLGTKFYITYDMLFFLLNVLYETTKLRMEIVPDCIRLIK